MTRKGVKPKERFLKNRKQLPQQMMPKPRMTAAISPARRLPKRRRMRGMAKPWKRPCIQLTTCL